ncbi:N-acetylglucosamine-6-phosphate deacetylase [Rothia sp. CCM 9418]|uniref:N-acetylglucosamine-6-phosphate deacetylase n=1 Tax=Rothia sp. CCM 9418 TaxID=3402661 RepID=UPI003AE1988E
MKTLIHSTQIFSPQDQKLSTGWAIIENGKITSQGVGEHPQLKEEHEILDGTGNILTRGYTDIHCHGGGGVAFEDPEECHTALKTHREQGTLRVIASLVTNQVPDMCDTVAALAQRCQEYAQPTQEHAALVGIHLEGPFLSPLHKGAHREDYLTAPTPELAEQLIEAGQGYIKQVTLAPETDLDLAATKTFVRHGVRVAVGHTDANYEQAKAAFDAGATLLTHTFNAMSPLHHRAPGPIAAALDTPGVTCEVIVDGTHVYAPMVRMLFAQTSERVALITDAMAAAGCCDGNYKLGSLDVTVKESVARLDSNGAIAGSTLTLGRATRTAYSFGIPLEQVLSSATTIPAQALGISDDYGLLLLDEELHLVRSFV